MSTYRTAPLDTPDMPPGIPYIVGNEAAERFSFYGMRGILQTYMTTFLVSAGGVLAVMTKEEAAQWQHTFLMAVYITPLIGAILADAWLGKYRTIVLLSLVYCLGHLALAVDVTRSGLFWGLALIAIGSGGIKGCVSAHVGDQFGPRNAGLVPRVYQWFYFSINVGSTLAFLMIPRILEPKPENPAVFQWLASVGVSGPHWAFGIPGIFMAIATVVFWMGRHRFAHIPPRGKQAVQALFTAESGRIIGRLAFIFVCIAVFWCLFDQTSSHWVDLAKGMDLNFLGWTFNPAESQVFNPILVLCFLPLTGYVLYPAIDKVFPLTPLRKIGLGFVFAIPSFLIPAWCSGRIDAGETPSVAWLFLAYVFITLAEVMISPTALEFSYTQAPKPLKSLMLGLNMASVSLGNFFTVIVNWAIQDETGKSRYSGAEYYLFFAGLMAVTAVIYPFIARRFQPKTYLHDATETEAAA